MSNYLISVQRTVAQSGAAWLVTQAARFGVELPGDAVTDAVFALTFAVFYAIYRLIEDRYPEIARLLGTTRLPHYDFDTGVDAAVPEADRLDVDGGPGSTADDA